MGATERTLLLGLLCLLLAPAGASQESEICLGFPPFHCPKHFDGTASRFCCGSCLAPYCCDSEEAHLDQSKCLHAWRMLQSCAGIVRNLGVLQDLQTIPSIEPHIRKGRASTGDTTPPPGGPGPTDVALAVLVHVLIVGLILLIIVCCRRCCSHFENDAPASFPMVVLSDPWPSDSSSPLKVYDPARPYAERPPLPLCSQEDPSNGSRREDRATARTRKRVRWSDEAATRSPTTSGATSGTAAAGEVTPMLEAAAGGENPGRGKATATGNPAGGGEGPSRVMSSAQGKISAQPAPVKKTLPDTSGWHPNMEDYQLLRQVQRGEDTPDETRAAQICDLRKLLSRSLPAHRGNDGANARPRRWVPTLHGLEEAAAEAPTTSGDTSATSEPGATGDVTPEPPVVSSAPGLISTQPPPLEMTILSSPGVIWEMKESEV